MFVKDKMPMRALAARWGVGTSTIWRLIGRARRGLLGAVLLWLAPIAFAYLTGCSAAGADPEAPALAFWPKDRASWEAFDATASRLEQHAGWRPVSGPSGYTIATMPRPEGDTLCARTRVAVWTDTLEVASIDIDLYVPVPAGCFPSLTDSLTHELIHAVRSASGLDVAENMDAEAHGLPILSGHSTNGVFAAHCDDRRLEESSLGRLCEAADCTNFEAEEVAP
jgi:hypothetical protein